MGLIVEVCFFDWKATYFVQTIDGKEAKEKALKAFRQTTSCGHCIPDTLEEAENFNGFYIEVCGEIDQIIL